MDKNLTKNKKPPPVKDVTKNKSRRVFITLTACAMAGIGAASGLWPLVKSINPSAEVLAISTVEFVWNSERTRSKSKVAR